MGGGENKAKGGEEGSGPGLLETSFEEVGRLEEKSGEGACC